MMEFKNDTERIRFLTERKVEDGWYLFQQQDFFGRRFWCRDFEEHGVSFFVEERRQTLQWPKKSIDWREMKWYILDKPDMLFEDGAASRTLALAKLKEMEKKDR